MNGLGTLALAIRPDDWNFPLFVHVLGAMVLMGAMLAGGGALALAHGEVRLQRVGYRSLLLVALPAWIVMRVGAEWIYSKEGWDAAASEPDWIGIGYIVADGTGLFLVVSLIVGGIGLRRRRDGGGNGLLRTAAVLSIVALAALVVATWAMGGKPG
ncbi:MAG: hypothetical protein AB7V42_09720 [Thermoleophilia bacterium]